MKRNTRGIKTMRGEGRKLTHNHIKPKHLRYMGRWQKRLALHHCKFTLRAVNKIGTSQRLAYVDSEGKHTYTIHLTLKTLSTSDWRDSILHELLHVFFWETLTQVRKRYKNRIKQSDALEEIVVSLFSRLVARR